MANVIALIFCWVLALVNYYAFPNSPNHVRLISAGVPFLCGLINLPFAIKYFMG